MRTVLLKDLATIEISNIDKKSKDGEQPVALCNFVDVYYNWAITKSIATGFMKATANQNQIERFSIHKGQVAITKDSETRDDIGVAVYIADDIANCVLGYHCALISPNESLLKGKYLNIILHSPYAQKYFEANASGSGQRYTLTTDIIGNFPVPLPADIAIQENFGALCSDIDAKIENNNAICSNLEAMAKLLYDYWFVQFDFPDENGKPYKTSGGKMVWNEDLKREIPEGWSSVDILDVCDIVDCLHSKKPEYCIESDACYLLTLENLTANGHIDLSEKYYISSVDYAVWTSKIEVQEGDFVVTNAGRAGDIGRIPRGVRCAIGRNLTAIRPVGIDSYYLNMFFHSVYVRSQIMNNLDQGSFFMSFNVHAIKKLKILVPEQYIMKKAVHCFRVIIERIEVLIEENQQLASLRDFLLPMLMNGQVKVGKVGA